MTADIFMGEGNGKKQILYVWPYREWGGAQIYLMGIMKHAHQRYDLSALMPSGSSERLLSYLEQLNVSYECFDSHMEMKPAHSISSRLKRRWAKARTEWVIALYLSHRRFRQSLLHMDFGPWSSFWFLLYLSLRGHVVITLHTALPQLSLLRRSIWKAKFAILTSIAKFHLLASNKEMIESLSTFVPQRALKRIRLAYSGIDRTEIESALAVVVNREQVCRRLGLPENRFLVFAMGQFIERKGCWTLLEAAKALSRLNNEYGFVWLGTEQLDVQTRERIERFELGPSFRFVTPEEIGKSRVELLSLLRIAGVFVLPSMTEGLPVALLEAMAMGIACVASDINAIPEAIAHSETGMLIAPGDVTVLVAALETVRTDEAKRDAIAKAGQAFVLEQFDERKTAQVTIELYDACQIGV